jgi:preprotein translocase subunit SecD
VNVDERGRDAASRVVAAVEKLEVPDPSAVVVRRRHRRRTRIAFAGVATVLAVAGGALAVINVVSEPSQSRQVQVQPTTPISPQTTPLFDLREVLLTVPMTGSNTTGACPDPASLSSPPAGQMFADRTGQNCYILGPTVLTGSGIDSASAHYDAASSQWLVTLRWRDPELQTKLAGPLRDGRIAIVSDGIVQSTPTIYSGIFDYRDVDIRGNFSRTDAITLAARIMGAGRSGSE